MQPQVFNRLIKVSCYSVLIVALLALLLSHWVFDRHKQALLNEHQLKVQGVAQLIEQRLMVSTSLLRQLAQSLSVQIKGSEEGVNIGELKRSEKVDYRIDLLSEKRPLLLVADRATGTNSDIYRELNAVAKVSPSLPIVNSAFPFSDRFYYLSKSGAAALFPGAEQELSYFAQLFTKKMALVSGPASSLLWGNIEEGIDGKLTVALGARVGELEPVSAVFMDLSLAKLSSWLMASFDSLGAILLIGSDNNVIAHSGSGLSGNQHSSQLSQFIPPQLHKVQIEHLLNAVDGLSIEDHRVNAIPVEGTPWSILVIKPEEELFAPASEQLLLTLLITLAAILMIAALSQYLARLFVVRPIIRLLEHLEQNVQQPKQPPQHLPKGWHQWFELISRSFEQTQQYGQHLNEQNRTLSKKVVERTERLRLVSEKREREFSMMRSLIDAIPEAIVYKDTDGRYLGCNKAAEWILGWSEAEILGALYTELKPSERGQRIEAEDARVLRERTPRRHQERMDVQGQSRLLDVLRLPFYNRRGELQGLIAVWRDITKETEQQERLKRSEQRYHLAMDAVEDGLWDWYLDSSQVICNPTWYTMLGYQPYEFPPLIETFFKLIHPDDRSRVRRYFDDHIAKPDSPLHLEFRLRSKGGQYRWILSRGRAVEFDDDAKPSRLLGTHKDITQQKENEVTLLEAKQDAELANVTKSEFLANMSHEIRTPMNAVLGMLQLTLRTRLDGRQQDYIEKARYSAESLLRIINDILDFSKIEAGKLELEQTEFSLDSVLEHTVSLNALRAQEKSVELLLQTPSSGLNLVGDPLRLGQVLVNLLSNAIKFTDEGEVELGCKNIDEGNGRVSLEFWVRDTGIGISASQREHLFDAFSQADGSTTRKFGGTGLGLSISSHLVALMGGEIAVDSELGKGTTFSFTIDAERVDTPSADEKLVLDNSVDGLKALVVDDNDSARKIYSTYLRDFDFRVSTSDCGFDALKRVERQQPDLVLLDWMMPEMDGVDVLDGIERLFKDGKIDHKPVVLFMTAYSGQALQGLLDAGRVQALLQKPFKASVLYDQLVAALNRQLTDKTDKTCSDEARASGSAHILLVEDNPINQQVATELLKSAGYKVELADNGAEAVEKVRDSHFDLVLMDIQMPVMDGLEATKAIRQFDSELPIVAMTAHAMAGDREKSLAAGMNDHITKPIALNELVDTVQYWLGNTVAQREYV